MLIDSVTRKIIDLGTAVDSAVGSTVTTAVDKDGDYKDEVKELYKGYVGQKWDDKAEKFYQSIKNINPDVIEAALILGILKDGNKNKHISDYKVLIKDLGNSVPKTYLNHLRDIWNKRKGGDK